MNNLTEIKNDRFEFQLLSDIEFKNVKASAIKLLDQILSKNAKIRIEDFWPGLNVDHINRSNIHLVFLPLDRVGSEPGFSGTRVLICYFKYIKNKININSHSLVVKIREFDKEKNKCWLENEKQRADGIYKYVTHESEKDNFAWPFHCDKADSGKDHGILWSFFYSSSKPQNILNPDQPFLTQKGLYSVLAESAEINKGKTPRELREYHSALDINLYKCRKTLELVFKYLEPLHWHEKKQFISGEDKSFVHVYRDYLRGFKAKGKWGDVWREIWGDKKWRKNCGKEKKYNPVYILKLIESYRKKICVGAIHGDLHPRNIVYDHKDSPRIIDFGWAAQETHIAKDFALMECNLRFMVLRPDIPNKLLKRLTDWIPFSGRFKTTKNVYVNHRAELINYLHEIAKSRFPSDTNWDTEYVVPMFLIALGLLRPKVLLNCHNRVAAIETIQTLADYLGNNVFN